VFYVLHNMLRRKLRTVFSVLGVGIGISIMVALFTISDDMIGQMTNALGTQRGDIVVSQAASDDLDSNLPVRLAKDVLAVPGVKRAAPTIFSFLRTAKGFSGQPAILYYGLVEDSPMNDAMKMVEGQKIADSDVFGVVFGARCWEIVNKRLGDHKYKIGDDLQLSDLITSPGIADLFGVMIVPATVALPLTFNSVAATGCGTADSRTAAPMIMPFSSVTNILIDLSLGCDQRVRRPMRPNTMWLARIVITGR